MEPACTASWCGHHRRFVDRIQNAWIVLGRYVHHFAYFSIPDASNPARRTWIKTGSGLTSYQDSGLTHNFLFDGQGWQSVWDVSNFVSLCEMWKICEKTVKNLKMICEKFVSFSHSDWTNIVDGYLTIVTDYVWSMIIGQNMIIIMKKISNPKMAFEVNCNENYTNNKQIQPSKSTPYSTPDLLQPDRIINIFNIFEISRKMYKIRKSKCISLSFFFLIPRVLAYLSIFGWCTIFLGVIKFFPRVCCWVA